MNFKRHFPVLVEQDIDGVFIVSCPLFQGCRSYGTTIDENIQKAIELCAEE
jgi:predicted RNase H-like HicB family nuclease